MLAPLDCQVRDYAHRQCRMPMDIGLTRSFGQCPWYREANLVPASNGQSDIILLTTATVRESRGQASQVDQQQTERSRDYRELAGAYLGSWTQMQEQYQ